MDKKVISTFQLMAADGDAVGSREWLLWIRRAMTRGEGRFAFTLTSTQLVSNERVIDVDAEQQKDCSLGVDVVAERRKGCLTSI